MTLEEAQILALHVLRTVMEEKLEPNTVEVGIIGADKQYKLLTRYFLSPTQLSFDIIYWLSNTTTLFSPFSLSSTYFFSQRIDELILKLKPTTEDEI